MHTAPTVDVILPSFNPDPERIKNAIRSIIKQTFKDWRLFVVNDGSKTDILTIVKGFDDDRIHHYEIPHSGKAAALNHALLKSTARYIAYLDDDDIWYPNHLNEAIACMNEQRVQFLYTDAIEIALLQNHDNYVEISRKPLHKGVISDKTLWFISHINVVHERSLLNKTGMYDETRTFFIDWDMFQRLAKFAVPYHLRSVTCEHYVYFDKNSKETNTISSIHRRNAVLSKKMQRDMFKRSFELLSSHDFADFVEEYLSQANQLETIRQELEETRQRLAALNMHINSIFNTWSWRLTSPIRKIGEIIIKLKDRKYRIKAF